jgi:hypothetical protein
MRELNIQELTHVSGASTTCYDPCKDKCKPDKEKKKKKGNNGWGNGGDDGIPNATTPGGAKFVAEGDTDR